MYTYRKIYEDICNKQKDIIIVRNLENVYKWLKDEHIKNLILPFETIGNKIFNTKDFLRKISHLGVSHIFYIREWDSNAFPHANKGFFNFKKKINDLINLTKIEE